MLPRYDLAYWLGRIGYVETTRYCNFRCSFCSLTAEGHGYQTYDLDHIRQQILASGKRGAECFFSITIFMAATGITSKRELKLINEMRAPGQFNEWGALVTNDFYATDDNLQTDQRSRL